ncbi:MAG: hypothetical protein ACM3ZR_09230, partial [Pseudomonadota bacterium]
MKRAIKIILCLLMIVSLGLPVNAAPITPILQDTTILPVIEDPLLKLDLFLAPSELKVSEKKSDSITLQWLDNSTSETKFVLERRASGGDFSQLAVLNANTTTYKDTTVAAATTYYYRIKAGKGTILIPAYTAYSNELKVDTPASIKIIGSSFLDRTILFPGDWIIIGEEDTGDKAAVEVTAPENLEGEAGSQEEISLVWEDKSDNEDGFLVYRTSGGAWEKIGETDTDEAEYVDIKLEPGTEYYYAVIAYKGNIVSKESNILYVSTPEKKAEQAQVTEKIAGPENLSAKVQGSGEVLLTWVDKSGNEEGFLLYRTATGEWEELAKLNTNAAAYSDKTVKAGTKYYYVIYAYAGSSASKESNIVEITVPGQENSANSVVDYTGASSWALPELQKAVEYGLYTDSIMNNYTQKITREEF